VFYGAGTPAGEARDGAVALDSGENSIEVLGESGGSITTLSAAPALPNTFGEQKVAVMLVNWQDDVSQPWTRDQLRNVLQGEANNFYLENSNQQTWLSADVYGWYTLPLSSTTWILRHRQLPTGPPAPASTCPPIAATCSF
jgi:hypothetical protein